MALKLYRRHRKECEAGHPEDSKSGEFEEGRRGWKRCGCPIHASGNIRAKFKRQSTGEWEWDAARSVTARWESAGTWVERPSEVASESCQVFAQSAAPTVPEATAAFLLKCETRGIRRTTLAKYRTFVNQLNAYAAHRGYIRIDQFSVLDMDRFYASWPLQKTTQATNSQLQLGLVFGFWVTNCYSALKARDGLVEAAR
jgi:hypothetical protein